MTHIIMLAEGFPGGMQNFEDHIKSAKYTLKSGAKHEIGTKYIPDVREIRFYDIVVKQDFKDDFLSHLKPFVGWSVAERETPRKEDGDSSTSPHVLHGNGKGFKIGLFRRMMQFAMSLLNVNPINMKKVKDTPLEENPIWKRRQELEAKGERIAWHGHYMVIGELTDGFAKQGRNKGREES